MTYILGAQEWASSITLASFRGTALQRMRVGDDLGQVRCLASVGWAWWVLKEDWRAPYTTQFLIFGFVVGEEERGSEICRCTLE